jgi:DNA modification methylase/uncharacterized protein YacL (UPF0231 family)
MRKRIDGVSDLVPDKTNANKGTQRGRGMVEASLRETGAGRSILADKNGQVIAGNKTIEAWVDIGGEIEVVRTNGEKLVVVQREDLDLSDDTGMARKLAYYDNRASEVGLEWDAEQLLADINAGVDLSAMFRDEELDALLESIRDKPEVQDVAPQVDKAEELRQKWQVETGQLWQLGEHRLICGDCTDADVVTRVMDGEKAHICFTSPPYNAGVSAKLRGNTSIDDNLYKDEYNDNQTQGDYLNLLRGFTDAALSACEYVFVNIQFLAGNKRAFVEYLHCFGDKLADIAIWDKKHAAPQQAQRVMDSRFEFVLVFSQGATRAIGTREFRGMVHNVYEGSPQRRNEYASSHAATFPIELPSHFIETFSNRGDVILEPFNGTGTTILACEVLSRSARAIEISPAYVAVALQRWADATGKTPVLLTN